MSLPADDSDVHPELALELVRKLRTRGGWWRLLQTAILLTAPVWLSIAIAAASALGILATGAATALLVRNVVQNQRAIRAARFINRVEDLPTPLGAVMDGRLLRIGTAGTSRHTWPELKISAREEQKLRQLALPAARVID